jgi:tRNA-splicing ligase RtcB
MKVITKKDLIKKSEVLWEISEEFKPGMLVPARIYAQEEMLDGLLSDRSLQQLVNVSTLPGAQKAVYVMPDVNEGYGFPIGGVAATRYPDGVISPGGIGYDINCGVRLLRTEVDFKDVKDDLAAISQALNSHIPSGVGQGGSIRLSIKKIDEVLKTGARWAVENGYGEEGDLEFIESHGCLIGADPRCVSLNAKKRGQNQLGTIGAGNHFVELDRIENIYEEETAKAFGLSEDQIVVLIHTGSRGLGHQIATDYLKIMMRAMPDYDNKPPDRELACVPFNSTEGQDYFKAMLCAANFAWCNREIISWEVRQSLECTLW